MGLGVGANTAYWAEGDDGSATFQIRNIAKCKAKIISTSTKPTIDVKLYHLLPIHGCVPGIMAFGWVPAVLMTNTSSVNTESKGHRAVP